MRIETEPPFQDYNGYLVDHKKEGRTFIVLHPKTADVKATSMSYARYLMGVSLGRRLTSKEEADHKNGNKADDRIENIQILSKRENVLKYRNQDNPSEKIQLVCPVCGSTFYRSKQRYKGPTQTCSRQCGGIKSRKRL